MHFLESFLDYYFFCGLPMFLLNLLFARLTTSSYTEAAKAEAIKCGATPTYAATRSAVHNMAFALFFWPVGIAARLLQLFS